jgi:hypothetical protein
MHLVQIWQHCALPWYCGWNSVPYAPYWWWAFYHHKGVQFLGVGWDWVHLVLRPLAGLLYQPQIKDNERGAVSGMKSGRGDRSTRRKPTPAPLYSPQISHHMTWVWTRPPRCEAADYRLSYGTGVLWHFSQRYLSGFLHLNSTEKSDWIYS